MSQKDEVIFFLCCILRENWGSFTNVHVTSNPTARRFQKTNKQKKANVNTNNLLFY